MMIGMTSLTRMTLKSKINHSLPNSQVTPIKMSLAAGLRERLQARQMIIVPSLRLALVAKKRKNHFNVLQLFTCALPIMKLPLSSLANQFSDCMPHTRATNRRLNYFQCCQVCRDHHRSDRVCLHCHRVVLLLSALLPLCQEKEDKQGSGPQPGAR